jgi:bifunctional non-homologous end joining protein LigD
MSESRHRRDVVGRSSSLRPAGIGSGLSREQYDRLMQRLQNLTLREDGSGLRRVRPELVIDVQFQTSTSTGKVRHGSFKGLRPDLDPPSVVRKGS